MVELLTDGNNYDACVLVEQVLKGKMGGPVDTDIVVARFATRFKGAITYKGEFTLEKDGSIADVVEETASGDIVEQIGIRACLTRDWVACSDPSEPYRVGEDFGILLTVTGDNFLKYRITKITQLLCGEADIELIKVGLSTNVLTVVSGIDTDEVYVRSVVQIAFFENSELQTKLECNGKVKLQLIAPSPAPSAREDLSRELEYEMEFDFSSVSRGMQKEEEGSFGLSIIIQDEIDEAAGAGGNAGVATAATAAAFFVGILLV